MLSKLQSGRSELFILGGYLNRDLVMNTVIEGKEILHVLLVSKIRLWKPRGAKTKDALLRHFNYVFSAFSIYTIYSLHYLQYRCRSQCPRDLRHRTAAVCLLRLGVRIPPVACCECCVWTGRGLCDEVITRPEESYRLWCVVVYDIETS